MRSSKSWRHFVLQVFSIHRRRKRSFDWPNSLLHLRYQKMRYFHPMGNRPYQHFRPMSHLISPHCPQSDRVHMGKTIIVIALFWLARRTEGGVPLVDSGKGWLQGQEKEIEAPFDGLLASSRLHWIRPNQGQTPTGDMTNKICQMSSK